jgi:hypothetical protein
MLRGKLGSGLRRRENDGEKWVKRRLKVLTL